MHRFGSEIFRPGAMLYTDRNDPLLSPNRNVSFAGCRAFATDASPRVSDFSEALAGFPGGVTAATRTGRSDNSSQVNALLPSRNRTVPSNYSHTVNFRFTKANFWFSSVS
jgi:hypothetical protein